MTLMHRDDNVTDLLSYPVTVRVVAFLVFVYAFWPFAAIYALMIAGLVPRVSAAPTPEETQALMRCQLLAGAIAFPLQIMSILLLPRVTGIRLEQIGWTFRGIDWNSLWGAVGWIILTPLCFVVNYGIIALYGPEAASHVEEHPFVQMSRQGMTPLDWFLLIFTATVAAPVMEEVLFRGALQSWAERRGWTSDLVMGYAVLNAVAMKAADVWAAWPRGGREVLLHLTPILFLLGLAVVYFIICGFSRNGQATAAVFSASALFAAVHSFAWPSPVALFVLALGLGWLAQRTRSLAGPIVLHSLFNAVSCVLLFFTASGVSP
jgi:membrane protease YdiL (CAAX protease family)